MEAEDTIRLREPELLEHCVLAVDQNDVLQLQRVRALQEKERREEHPRRPAERRHEADRNHQETRSDRVRNARRKLALFNLATICMLD